MPNISPKAAQLFEEIPEAIYSCSDRYAVTLALLDVIAKTLPTNKDNVAMIDVMNYTAMATAIMALQLELFKVLYGDGKS